MSVANDADVDTAKKAKGDVKEVLGAVTGDRRVEAEGRAEQRVADPAAPETEESQETVDGHEDAVRRAHGDVPGAPGDEGPLGT
jgi:uncharacterized protein YjbJ (UPF0337 family)